MIEITLRERIAKAILKEVLENFDVDPEDEDYFLTEFMGIIKEEDGKYYMENNLS